MKNIVFALILGLFSLLTGFAQNKGSLKGTVHDTQGEVMIGAVVVIKETNQFAQVDAKGRYALEKLKPQTSYTVMVSYLGYQTYMKTIQLEQEATLAIVLKEESRDLDEIKIHTKSKAEQVKEKAYNVAVVDATKLHMRAMDIGHAMAKTSGIKIREEGGVGSNMNVFLNGYSGNQIKFFIDGIPMDNFGSSFQLNNIPINLANRIEIYKGVVPVGLGSDALGGAINIITNTYDQTSLDMSYSYASFNTHRSNVNFVYVDKKTGFFTQFNAYQNYSDNDYKVTVDITDVNTNKNLGERRVRRFHDKYHNENFVGQIGFVKKPFADRLSVGITLGQSYKEVQTGMRMIAVYGKIHQRGDIVMPTLAYEKKNLFTEGLDVRLNASYNLGSDQVIDTMHRRYNWLGEYIDKEEKYGSKGGERNRTFYKFKNNNGMVATVVNYKLGDKHNFSLSNTINFFKRKGEDAMDLDDIIKNAPSGTTKNISGLSYQFTPSTIWSVTAFGKYYNQHITYTDSYNPSGKWGDYVYEDYSVDHNYFGYGFTGSVFVLDDLQLKASFEKSTRLPSANELFGDKVNLLGNNKLRPEISYNYNLGANYNLRWSKVNLVNFDVNGFFRNTQDMIVTQPGGNNKTYQTNANLASTRNTGIEGEVRYFYKNNFNIGITGTYQNLINTNRYVDGQEEISIFYKDRLPNIPYVYGNADVNYTFSNVFKNDNLTLGYSLFYTKSFYLYWPSVGSKADGKFTIPDQITHDFVATYSFGKDKNYQFTVEAHNVFDKMVYDNFSLQKPGRSFSGKFRYFF